MQYIEWSLRNLSNLCENDSKTQQLSLVRLILLVLHRVIVTIKSWSLHHEYFISYTKTYPCWFTIKLLSFSFYTKFAKIAKFTWYKIYMMESNPTYWCLVWNTLNTAIDEALVGNREGNRCWCPCIGHHTQ